MGGVSFSEGAFRRSSAIGSALRVGRAAAEEVESLGFSFNSWTSWYGGGESDLTRGSSTG